MNFKDIPYVDNANIKQEEDVFIVNNAKRHVIRINNITAKRKKYNKSTVIKSKELITRPVKSIALFCSEYIPVHFPEDKYFTYVFTINGKDYEVEPINSHRPGNKVIKVATVEQNEAWNLYIDEEIKSAFLTITIKTPSEIESPFLSDIKILYGSGGNENANI